MIRTHVGRRLATWRGLCSRCHCATARPVKRAPDRIAASFGASVPQSLSVVVPTFRRPQSLERCLRALAIQTRPPDEVIVACRADDEASLDATSRLASEMPIRVVVCDQPRLCAQMDLGVASATGDVVALTDDDAAPTEQWAERLMTLYSEPRVGAVGGRDVIRDPAVDSTSSGESVGTVTPRGQPLGNHHREGLGVRDVDFLKGVNLSVRRRLWHVDLNLLGNGNQSHWELGTCLRIRRLGWRVLYDPQLLVDHYPDPRMAEPQRGSRDAYTLERDAHNQLYELIRWLPWWQSAMATARGLIVGSRELPGLLIGVWLVTRGVKPRRALAEAQSATAGRVLAVRARPRRNRWTAP